MDFDDSVDFFNQSNSSGPMQSDPEPAKAEEDVIFSQILAFARVAMVPTSLIGLTGNVLNLLILGRAGVRDTSVSVYLIGLAIGDMLFCIDIFRWYLEWSGLLPQELNYDVYCKIMNFVGYFSTGFSHWMIFCVSLERMIMVTFPFKAKSICTVNKARGVVCFFALTMAACVSINFVYVQQIHGVDETWICWVKDEDVLGRTLFNIFRLIFEVPPVVFVLVLNIVTIVFFFRSRAKSSLSSASQRAADFERKLTLTLVATGLVFVVLELPYLIILLLMHMTGNSAKMIAVANIFKLLSGFDHSCNFFIYILGAPMMRREFSAMLREFTSTCRKTQDRRSSLPPSEASSRPTHLKIPSPSQGDNDNDSTDMTVYSVTPVR